MEELETPQDDPPPPRRSLLAGREALVVRSLSVAIVATGFLNLLSAVTPALTRKVHFPVEVQDGAHLAAALTGLLLMALGGGLWRRKRIAWALAVTALAVSAFSHLLRGAELYESLLSGVVGLVLASLEYHFHARSDPPSVAQGIRTLLLSLLVTLTYGTLGFLHLDRHMGREFTLWDSLRQVFEMFLGAPVEGLPTSGHIVEAFEVSIYAIGASTLLYSAWMLLRPVLMRETASPEQRARARDIVEAWGRTTLARFTLFDDKAYFFATGGSVIAYVAKGRVALALGDPIGPPDDAPKAIAEFQAFAQGNDWLPAFYQVLPDYLDHYRQAGLSVAAIGQEAVVPLADFTLTGKAGQRYRSAKNKLEKVGYTGEVLKAPQSDELLAELRDVSDEWLSLMKGREKRFSLGWFDAEYLRACPVVVVRNAAGSVVAFANILREYQKNEATLDLMRRRGDADGGTMDYLFAVLFEWARGQGFEGFNLGLSALSGVGEKVDDPKVERAFHYLYEHLNRFYNFQGLHAFKEKFHPTWEPRYLVYPGSAMLPAVGLALVRADSGDGFLADYVIEWKRR